MSLRTRLLAGVGLVAIVLVIVSAVVTVTTRDQLIDQVDRRLALFTPSGPDLQRIPRPEPIPPSIPVDGFRDRVSDVYEGFVGPDGVLEDRFLPNVGDREYTAPAVTADDLPTTGGRLFTVSSVDGGVTYRVNAVRVGDVVVVTGVPLDDVEDTIRRLVVVEVVGSVAILAALGLVAWWMLRLGIRPVKEMTESASRIADGRLDERVPEAAPGTEPGDLAIALNRMLAHIGDAMDERAASEDRLRQFVADASHELRTPVTTIRGYAELYRHGGLADEPAVADAMRRTEQEATRMARLVDDLLTLAKLDQERPLDLTGVDLTTVAADAVDDARVVAPARRIDLRVSDGPTTVLADEDRIRQVVANVVGNALAHTDDEAPVEVAVQPGPGTVAIVVHDRGDGMAPEVADRATERFYRADAARSRHRGGSGLGLSIVAATVHAHGGTIGIDSAPGEGTTVTLTLPAEGPPAT